jgi:fructosamine-3-kinase
MNRELRQTVERELGSAVLDVAPASGGCIHETWLVTLGNGECFVKTSREAPEGLFEAEAEGLAALAQGGLRAPVVLTVGFEPQPHLVLEAIAPGRPRPDFGRRLGHDLARLHLGSTAVAYGWRRDNWLGPTPHANAWGCSWPEFFGQRRLAPLLARLVEHDAPAELLKLGDRLLARLDQVLAGPPPRASLLHGDLWHGNVLCGPDGDPVVIDPAVSYGEAEFELAMPALFGGFDPGFASAYHELLPPAEGFERRLAVYRLYHLLNHLLIFGSSYVGQSLAILRAI